MHGIHCLLDCMHVFIPTYMYACIHCFLHCMHVFINTWHAFIHACIHCFLHCMHAFISTYMHGIHCLLLHACIYFYIHACMHVFINNWHAFIHAWHSLFIRLHACIYSYIHVCMHSLLFTLHACIHKYLACIYTCMHSLLFTLHACIYFYIHAWHSLFIITCMYLFLHTCMHDAFINNWHAFIHAWHSLVIILHACIYSYVVLSATCTRTRQAMRRSLWAFFVPDIAVKNCDVSTSALHIHTQTPPSNVDLTHISLKQDGAVLDGALTTSRYKFWSVLSKLYKSQIDNSVDHDDFIVDNSSFLIK